MEANLAGFENGFLLMDRKEADNNNNKHIIDVSSITYRVFQLSTIFMSINYFYVATTPADQDNTTRSTNFKFNKLRE